ncbi:MAG: hypothetical protein K9M97_11140 [Akkermansiaceae bacterium]|nr:hypothetical protein [Akkermansiaceae bacterium]
MSENHQVNDLIINLIQQMVWEFAEIGSAHAACVKMVASGMQFNRCKHGIQIIPKSCQNPLGYLRIVHRDFTDVGGEVLMSDHLHRSGTSTGSPKVLFGQPLDSAGLEVFEALQSVLITDMMRAGIKVLKERRNQLRPIKRIELGSLSDQFCDLRHDGRVTEFRKLASACFLLFYQCGFPQGAVGCRTKKSGDAKEEGAGMMGSPFHCPNSTCSRPRSV